MWRLNRVVCVALSCFRTMALLAQIPEQQTPSETPPVFVLHLGRSHPIAGFTSPPYMGSFLCDDDQNAYVKALDAHMHSFQVMKISNDGAASTNYKFPDDLVKEGGDWSVFVNPAGVVFALYSFWDLHGVKRVLVRFDSDGKVDSRIPWQIPGDDDVRSFAVLPSGQAIVRGETEASTKDDKTIATSFLAFVDQSGTMKLLDQADASRGQRIDASKFLDGFLTVGDYDTFFDISGNTLTVFDANGHVLRRFSFRKPRADAFPMKAQVVAGRLAIDYGWSKAEAMPINDDWLVLDIITGESIGVFAMPEDFMGSSVCFAGRQGFTYFTGNLHNIALTEAPLP